MNLIDAIVLFKTATFFLIFFTLFIEFKHSNAFGMFLYYGRIHFLKIVSITFISFVAILYTKNHDPSIIDILNSFYYLYKFIIFTFLVSLTLIRIRLNHEDEFDSYIREHYPKIILYIFLGILSFFVIKNIYSVGIQTFDIFVFCIPFIKMFIFGSLILFLVMHVMQQVQKNVFLINYTELAIYFLGFLFVCWIASSTVLSFGLIRRSIAYYFTESKQLSARYIFILYSIFGFIVTTFLLFIFVMASRIIKTILEIIRRYLRVQYQDNIIAYVYETDEDVVDEVSYEFIEAAADRSKFRRSLILRELIFLHRNLSGDLALKTKELYNNAKLYRDSYRSLKQGSWTNQVKAMNELAFMDHIEAQPEIEKKLKSKNEIIRKEAQIAIVKLNNSPDALLFLQDYAYYFSDYEQIIVLNVLRRNKTHEVNLAPLFDSKNDTVVIFALKLTGIFEQNQNYPFVIRLLNHPNPKICAASLYALKKLWLPESSRHLLYSYDNQSYQNKLKLLEVLEQISSEENEQWLLNKIRRTTDFNLLLALVRVLNKITTSSESEISEYFEGNEQIELLLNHVRDKRI